MSHRESAAPGLQGRLVDRMLFFSDAVFAIIMTLLALELRAPEEFLANDAELAAVLRHGAPEIVAFVGSFAIIGIFWSAHMRITRDLRQFDWSVSTANLAFLLTIALLPFTTAIAAGQGWSPLAFRIYALNICAASAMQMLLLWVEMRNGGSLVGGITSRELVYRLLRGAAPGIAFGLGFAASVTGHVEVAPWCWALIPIIILAANLVRPSVASQAKVCNT